LVIPDFEILITRKFPTLFVPPFLMSTFSRFDILVFDISVFPLHFISSIQDLQGNGIVAMKLESSPVKRHEASEVTYVTSSIYGTIVRF
jgi:hypothetical protein